MNKLLYQYSLFIITLSLFLYEYFPLQKTQSQDAILPPTHLNNIDLNLSEVYKPQVDRIVFVLVDALRLDFVNNDNFPFSTSTVLKDGCMLKVHVQSPTVTLPRLKALLTGRVPQFLDVLFNLEYLEALKDSVLHRAKQAGKRIIFYGDVSWIKLFPDMFKRHEIVMSYNVNDFTEVDTNVTRNIDKELNKNDWDLMFVHYAGLDHIGHIYGPFSHLIHGKLLEMDSVIERIYRKTQTSDKKTLIFITGDHGMKDSGGHGGTTLQETFVPLLVLGNKCKNASIVQTDISATLAALMGITLPSGNTGRIVTNIFETLSHKSILYLLNYGASTLKLQTSEYKNIYKEASDAYYKFLQTQEEVFAENAKSLYEKYLDRVSTSLSQTYLEQNHKTLLVCIMVMLNYLLHILHNYLNPNSNIQFKLLVITFIPILQHIIPDNPFTCFILMSVLCSFIFHYLVLIIKSVEWKGCDLNMLIIFSTNLYLLSLQSSSFIEEEHQLWYFFFGTCILALSYLEKDLYKFTEIMSMFVLLRIFRTLNPCGDKWSHLPTISRWLLLNNNIVYLYTLLGISMILLYRSCYFLTNRHSILSIIIITLIFLFHTWILKDPLLGKIIWLLLVLNFATELRHPKNLLDNIIIFWIHYCALLLRPYNVILLPICVCTCLIIKKYVKNLTVLTGLYVWIGRTFFFLQGHGNSLAAVDVAAGYVGVTTYTHLIVIPQVLCHSYAFPTLTTLLVLRGQLMYSNIIWNCSVIHRTFPLIFTCIVVFIQKHHLFVWSVFCPKLLIESCHCLILLVQLFIFYVIEYVNAILFNKPQMFT